MKGLDTSDLAPNSHGGADGIKRLAWKLESLTSVSSTAMPTFESLPVELVSDILGETDVESLIGVSSYVVLGCSPGGLNSASRRNSCVWLIPQAARNSIEPCAQPVAPPNPTWTPPGGIWGEFRESQSPYDRPKAQLDRDHDKSRSGVSAVRSHGSEPERVRVGRMFQETFPSQLGVLEEEFELEDCLSQVGSFMGQWSCVA
jgi:hypothetical protein